MNIFFLVVTLLLTSWVAGQQAKLGNRSIRIIDAATKQGVNSATARLIRSDEYASADDDGRIFFTSGQSNDSLEISAIGYLARRVSFSDLIEDDVQLARQSVQLQAVTISSSANPLKTINDVDIRLRPINNSQEVLRIVPGLFVSQHGGGGKAEQIFLRGFDLDHGTDISIAVDGLPVNMVSHAHGQGYADLHFLIPELIEEVSFGKGPYEASKGNLATSGYVDFRTRTVLERDQIKTEAGRFNTFRALGMVSLISKSVDNKSAYVAADFMSTRGYFDSPQDFRRLNLFGKYSQQIGLNTNLTVSASTFYSKWKASGQIPERAVVDGLITFFGAIDPTEGGETSRSDVSSVLRTDFKDGSSFSNQVNYTAYDFSLFSNFTFFSVDSVNGDQILQKEKRSLFGYLGSYKRSDFVGKSKIMSEVGADVRVDFVRGSELSRTKHRTDILKRLQFGDIQELNSGLYLKETVLINRWRITAGVRFDHFKVQYQDRINPSVTMKSTQIVSPKLGLSYRAQHWVDFYAKAGRGFHSNDTRLVLKNGMVTLPAAFGLDVGTTMKITPKILINIAAWYLHMDQEFVYVGDEGIVEPNGRSRRAGVDFSLRYQPSSWLFFDADANYSRARFLNQQKGSDFIPLTPNVTTTGGLTIITKWGLNSSFRYRFMNDRPANADNSVIAQGYFINDFSLSYTWSKFEWGLDIQNLFNVRWKEAQFDTESRLKNEPSPVSEIHFTPGTPFFLKVSFAYFF